MRTTFWLARARRGGWIVGLAVWLTACGGGGGSNGSSASSQPVPPPTAAATLANSTTEATEAVKAVAGGGDTIVSQYGTLQGINALFKAQVGGQATADAVVQRLGTGEQPVRALAVSTSGCDDFVDSPCSGSATIDTNVADNATSVAPGDYADIRFARVTGPLLGRSFVLDGRLRITFETALNLNATRFAGLSVLLTMEGFGGSVNGLDFGPITQNARLQLDSAGASTVTADGASFSGLSGVTISSSGNYSVSSGRVRVAYWGNRATYVDITLTNWRVVSGRPAVGSTATVTAGAGSATLRVTSSSQNTVVQALTLSAAGVTTSFVVTASYPAGGGLPTYTAVPG